MTNSVYLYSMANYFEIIISCCKHENICLYIRNSVSKWTWYWFGNHTTKIYQYSGEKFSFRKYNWQDRFRCESMYTFISSMKIIPCSYLIFCQFRLIWPKSTWWLNFTGSTKHFRRKSLKGNKHHLSAFLFLTSRLNFKIIWRSDGFVLTAYLIPDLDKAANFTSKLLVSIGYWF